MNNNNDNKVQANTLGNLAQQYGFDIRVLITMLEANTQLWNDIKVYIDNVRQPGKKLLPPKIIHQIFETLGEP